MVTQVWSSGGGTQSTAIAALIIQGKLPKPDISLIVDTEREKNSTWDYLNQVVQPALLDTGVEIVRIKKSDYTHLDLYDNLGESILLPGYSTINGQGKMSNFCSYEWKRNVIKRYLRAIGVQTCEQWLGISIDEMQRVRMSRQKWFQHRYPLIELRMRRDDCYKVIQDIGWPSPPRSSCWMCPNMGNFEWLEMKLNYPEDFQRAIAIEEEIRAKDKNFYLHSSCVRLAEVDFSQVGRLPLFDDKSCSSGYCFI